MFYGYKVSTHLGHRNWITRHVQPVLPLYVGDYVCIALRSYSPTWIRLQKGLL